MKSKKSRHNPGLPIHPRVLVGKMMRGKGVEYPSARRLGRSGYTGLSRYGNAMRGKRKRPWRRWALYASLLVPAHLVMFYFLFGWGAQIYDRVFEHLGGFM